MNKVVDYKIGQFNIGLIVTSLEIKYIKLNNKNFIYDLKDSWTNTFPFLFPICGKLNQNKFFFEGKEYEMKMHGFFHKLNWSLISDINGALSFGAMYSQETLGQYPFKFSIQMDIGQRKKELLFNIKIKNLDNKDMYYSFGFHPSFKCDENSKIVFENVKQFSTNINKGIVHSNKKDSYDLDIKEIKVSDLNFTENGLTYISRNMEQENVLLKTKEFDFDIEFKNDWNNDLNFLLWRMGKNKSYVCLEPWWGSPDSGNQPIDIKNKNDIQTLKSNDECNYQLKISIS